MLAAARASPPGSDLPGSDPRGSDTPERDAAARVGAPGVSRARAVRSVVDRSGVDATRARPGAESMRRTGNALRRRCSALRLRAKASGREAADGRRSMGGPPATAASPLTTGREVGVVTAARTEPTGRGAAIAVCATDDDDADPPTAAVVGDEDARLATPGRRPRGMLPRRATGGAALPARVSFAGAGMSAAGRARGNGRTGPLTAAPGPPGVSRRSTAGGAATRRSQRDTGAGRGVATATAAPGSERPSSERPSAKPASVPISASSPGRRHRTPPGRRTSPSAMGRTKAKVRRTGRAVPIRRAKSSARAPVRPGRRPRRSGLGRPEAMVSDLEFLFGQVGRCRGQRRARPTHRQGVDDAPGAQSRTV